MTVSWTPVPSLSIGVIPKLDTPNPNSTQSLNPETLKRFRVSSVKSHKGQRPRPAPTWNEPASLAKLVFLQGVVSGSWPHIISRVLGTGYA